PAGIRVYNFEVEGNHTYFAGATGGGASVHNDCLIGPEMRSSIASLLRRINRGDPLPYVQDGTVFANREGFLPMQQLGYYREYTVTTAGEATCGPARLVIGVDGVIFATVDYYTRTNLI